MFLESDIVKNILGNIPVIVTSQHDGNLTKLNGIELPIVFNVSNDIGTRDLVEEVIELIFCGFSKPYFLIYKVRKSRSSWELYEEYLLALKRLSRKIIGLYGKCVVLDIHRFHKKPDCVAQKDCDIIFGTDLGKSVNDGLDIRLANLLKSAINRFAQINCNIFVPTSEEIEGVKFGARGLEEGRVIQSKWLKERVLEVNTIQIEIFQDLLVLPVRQKIAKAFAYAVSQLIR